MDWLARLARSRERRRRLADFELLCAYDPDGVSRVDGESWRYLTAQPFADDAVLLANLGLEPGDCRRVDCTWHAGSDVVHLRLEARAGSAGPPFGLHARRADGARPRIELFAVVAEDRVTRAGLVGAMRRIAAFGLPRLEDLRASFTRLDGLRANGRTLQGPPRIRLALRTP